MSAANRANGFLSVIEVAERCYCGGLLVLNQLGRPLEFHCTLPLIADRAQQILYGPTLNPFLYGEHLGRALVEKSKTEPAVVFVDARESLELRRFVNHPVALVTDLSDQTSCQGATGVEYGSEMPAHHETQPQSIEIEPYQLTFLPAADGDEARIEQVVTELLLDVHLTEPFRRIHEAIREAQAAAG